MTDDIDKKAFENNHKVSERLPVSYAGQALGLHDGGWKQKVGPADIPEGRFPANLILDEEAAEALGEPSRFFYCAKVGTKERNAGVSGKSDHPTMKPLALTEYLAKLLLVPPQEGKTRRILVPFSGSGSEMIGALLAGWDEVWGIELSPEYCDIAKARIVHHTQATALS